MIKFLIDELEDESKCEIKSIVEGKTPNSNGFYKIKVEPKVCKFYSDENNYGIYLCKDLSTEKIEKGVLNEDWISYEDINIVGNMPKLILGKSYDAIAELTTHNSYGEQFKIHSIYSLDSNSSEDEKSMAMEFVSGGVYNQIIEIYDYPITALLNGTFDYTQIKGMGKDRYESLLKKAELSQKYIKAQSELSKYGVTFNTIKKIVDVYGSSELAVEKVNKNPYILYHDIKGIGFLKADVIAKSIGFAYDCSERKIAGIVYALELEELSGNTWNYITNIKTKVEELLKLQFDDFDKYLDNKMFYHDEKRIAMKKVYNCEDEISLELHRLKYNTIKSKLDENTIKFKLDQLEKNLKFEYTESQKRLFFEINKNNIVVLTGYAGTGKCVNGETYIYTDKGMIKIKDIPKYFKVNDTSCESEIISYDLSGNKKNKTTSNWYNMGCSETIELSTSQGYKIEGTPEHPIIILNQYGELEFKKLKDIKKSDIVAISKNNNLWGNEFINLDLAYIVGFLIGDGCLNAINYSSIDYNFYSKHAHNKLSELGMCWTTSKYKYIPDKLLCSKKECVASLIQGLFDTDASVDKRGTIEYTTASKILAEQIHLLLLNFGIVSRLTLKFVGIETYYMITVSGEYTRIFKNEIGFRLSESKLNRLNTLCDKKINPNIDVLYYQNNNIKKYIHSELIGKDNYNKINNYKIMCKDGVIRSLLNVFDNRGRNCSSYLIKNIINSIDVNNEMIDYLYNLSNNLFFDKLLSIENKKSEVFDFTVPSTHSFVSNGFISHNTFLINGLLKVIQDDYFNIMLVSPTAKAAKVLSNSTGQKATTIHRALKYNQGKFEYNESNKLRCDFIIVDEASMIDIYLFRSLLKALPNGCKMLIVGDTAQLESVAVGNVLHDIINSNLFPVVALKEVFRQALDSGILLNATKIREGKRFYDENTNSCEYGVNKDFKLWFGSKEQSCDRVKFIYEQIIKKCSSEDILVITPMKVGNAGVINLNKEIQSISNPYIKNKNEIKLDKLTFREGDKVRHTKNDYNAEWYDESYNPICTEKGVFNGDFGIIKYITPNKDIFVDYGEKIIKYISPYKNLDLAYAITAHSSQGSQSRIVIGVMDISHYMNLKRNLLYTLITRAQEKLFLVAEKKAIGIAMYNNTIPKKQTFLEEKIKEYNNN